MADFVAVLKKTIDGMGETTPQTRGRVYDKARSTIAAKLAAIVPPPPQEVAERQKRTLEEAIAEVEKHYAKPVPPPAAAADPLAELESIFSSIDRNKNQSSHVPPPAAKAEPVRQPPAASAPLSDFRTSPASALAHPVDAPAAKAPALSGKPIHVAAGRSESIPETGPKPDVREEEFSTSLAGSADADAFRTRRPQGMRRRGRIAGAIVALLVVAGGAYGVWLNADAFKAMLGGDDAKPQAVEVEPLASPAGKTAAVEEPAAAPTPKATPAPAAPEAAETPKFTQRLTPEGKEVDPGPAGGESTIGEGTSVVALTTQPPGPTPSAAPAGETTEPAPAPAPDDAATPPAAESEPAAAPEQPALAVGQKAIFYEERTNVAEGSAEPGSIVWSLVQESPGGDAPPEPAIRAEANIPGKNVQLRMTIRRNADETLPASHIIELIFLTPEGFDGGGIDNILRVAMKASEQDAGSPLIGIPAKIADGFFLVALNDTKADEQANITLLRNQDWIDIPVVYKTGRRALITMEKGIPGDKVFDEALKAWQEKTAG